MTNRVHLSVYIEVISYQFSLVCSKTYSSGGSRNFVLNISAPAYFLKTKLFDTVKFIQESIFIYTFTVGW
jgi:hypothetical protein